MFLKPRTTFVSALLGINTKMVHGLWFMVHGSWFMVYGSWFMVHGLLGGWGAGRLGGWVAGWPGEGLSGG